MLLEGIFLSIIFISVLLHNPQVCTIIGMKKQRRGLNSYNVVHDRWSSLKAVSEELENAYNYCYYYLLTYTFQHCLKTGIHNSLFDGRGFAENQSKIWGN